MPKPDDQKLDNESDPIEADFNRSDRVLENTQFFTEDSSDAGTGTGSTPSAVGTGRCSSSSKKQKSVGGYRLIRMLGEGGMGQVFQAIDESGRMVAIKLLSPELSRSTEALDRFKQEGVIASAISHPHCVFVHRADEDSGTPFIAMELMTGQTLKDIVANRGPLPYTEAIPLALQCIDGLIEAHSRGMIHRDVKPANCYLDDQGNVKIGDFGLARSLVSDSELTRTGSFLGTPLYASPEQILGEKVDEQSDIYSLAATIYFLLAGKAPFESPHATQVIAKIVSADPPRFSDANVIVPKKLEQVVLRGLARDRSKRYAVFQEFRDELVQTLGQPDQIATLTRRVLAYMVDNFLMTMVIGLPMLLSLFFGDQFIQSQYYINLIGTLWQATYLLFCESLFGATIGKRLLSLRVVAPDSGTRPRFRSCFLRTLVFILVFNILELVIAVVLILRGTTIFEAPYLFAAASWIGALFGYTATLTVWFKTGKKQLLHEWISNTQTWVASPKSVVNAIELPELNWVATLQSVDSRLELPTHLGRFEIRGKIATADDSNWLAAHDETIERSVWIQLSPSSSPPLSKAREMCVRRTRMRFLESGIVGNWRWDAYVAPDGAPIALWFDHRNPMPWPVTQHVLWEAIEESHSNAAETNAASIGRWWLTSAGKLTLSEANIKTGFEPEATSINEAPLFSEIASLALPDRRQYRRKKYLDPITPKSTRYCVAPLRATKLLLNLKADKVAQPKQIQEELVKFKQGPQFVTVAMRVIHAVVLSLLVFLPWLIIVIAMVFPIVTRVVDQQKDARLLTTLAAVLQEPKTHVILVEGIDASKRSSYLTQSRIATIDRVAEDQHSRFTKAYNDLGFLERGSIELMNRLRGREEFAAKPEPDFTLFVATDDERKEAAKGLKESRDARINSPQLTLDKGNLFDIIRIPEPPQTLNSAIAQFESLEAEQKNPPTKRWFARVRDLTIIPLAVLVVWGGIFRGGLTHLVSGIAVVRRDGRRGWVLQCMWRSLLFWIPPFFVAAVCLALDAQGTEWVWWTQQLRRCFFVLPLLYLIIAFRWPSRGPHDVLSGTYVVPR